MTDAAALPAPGLSLWKAIGWSIAFVLLGVAVMIVAAVLYAAAAHGGVAPGLLALREPGLEQALVNGGAEVLGFGLVTWLIGFRVLGLRPAQLRWLPASGGLGWLGRGLLLGALAALVALLVSVPAGGARWLPDQGSALDYAASVVKTTIALAPAALGEELIFRGLPLVLVAAAVGRVPAIVALSLLFGLGHAGNAHVTPVALANIALAGAFLAVVFYTPGGLWASFGAHLGWNAMLAALDAPVSGLPFRIPLIDYAPGGPAWLTGGAFGPEGGLTATLAITLATLAAGRWTRKEQVQA